MQLVNIELTQKEAETFKKFRRFQEDWEKIFGGKFTGSLTIHSSERGEEVIFEWKERKKYIV